jgi:beta-glucanase (GH16 family)
MSGALHYSSQNLWEPAVAGVDATQWHNYAVSWTPTAITYYIDGVPWKTYTDTSQFPPGPMHLAIQLDAHSTTLTGGATMDVAWAKQWSLPSTAV